MNGYYVVGVTAILYLGFVVLINIVSKKDMPCHITIGIYALYLPWLYKNNISIFRKEKEMGAL